MDFSYPPNRRSSARNGLTAEQQDLADRLRAYAERLRDAAAADGESLSIREAVELAVVQLGLDR